MCSAPVRSHLARTWNRRSRYGLDVFFVPDWLLERQFVLPLRSPFVLPWPTSDQVNFAFPLPPRDYRISPVAFPFQGESVVGVRFVA